MKWVKPIVLLLLLAAVFPFASWSATKGATVKGYVIDSACAFVKSLKKPISPACATACAQTGSPLVILASDGTIYWPISKTVPATGQNERLMKYAGQKVAVRGTVYIRGGSHAIVIGKIEPVSAGK